MRRHFAICLVPLALAACDVQTNDSDGDNVHVSLSSKDSGGGPNRVSINVPGFNANVNLPGLNLGGHMDLDGVKLAPSTSVKNMDVQGDDNDSDGHGTVKIAFTNPDSVDKLLDYYRKALTDASFKIDSDGGAAGIKASKDTKNFALTLGPDGSGSKGMITIAGD
jgi:hypothetical protein